MFLYVWSRILFDVHKRRKDKYLYRSSSLLRNILNSNDRSAYVKCYSKESGEETHLVQKSSRLKCFAQKHRGQSPGEKIWPKESSTQHDSFNDWFLARGIKMKKNLVFPKREPKEIDKKFGRNGGANYGTKRLIFKLLSNFLVWIPLFRPFFRPPSDETFLSLVEIKNDKWERGENSRVTSESKCFYSRRDVFRSRTIS